MPKPGGNRVERLREGSGARMPEVNAELLHFPAVPSEASYLISPYFSFHTHKMGMVIILPAS